MESTRKNCLMGKDKTPYSFVSLLLEFLLFVIPLVLYWFRKQNIYQSPCNCVIAVNVLSFLINHIKKCYLHGILQPCSLLFGKIILKSGIYTPNKCSCMEQTQSNCTPCLCTKHTSFNFTPLAFLQREGVSMGQDIR